jgi:hypothetical protein
MLSCNEGSFQAHWLTVDLLARRGRSRLIGGCIRMRRGSDGGVRDRLLHLKSRPMMSRPEVWPSARLTIDTRTRSSKTRRSVGRHVDGRRLAHDELRDNLAARRPSGHAEMPMAHRKAEPRSPRHFAGDRKTVRRRGTKSHPQSVLPCIYIGEHPLDVLQENLCARFVWRCAQSGYFDRSGNALHAPLGSRQKPWSCWRSASLARCRATSASRGSRARFPAEDAFLAGREADTTRAGCDNDLF